MSGLAVREIRDPVHGFISVDDTECRIIDSPPLQRLRGIHQLALARLLYPGATHSRFEHSLGVYHIASLMCRQLGVEGDDRRRVAHAALLHDVGHGPFSHVSEGPLGRYATKETLQRVGGNRSKIHELVTCDIVARHPGLQGIEGLLRSDVCSLIRGDYPDRVLRSIISGPLDADKQDYLLRDSMMCGVRYGVFDIDQLRLCLTSGDDGYGRVLMVRRDGVHAVEQFAMAKYYITRQVYAHRVRLVTDQMLTRAIVLGVEADGVEELRELYTYDGSDEFTRRYAEWDDWRLLQALTHERLRGKLCHLLLDRLRRRILHKQVFATSLRELPAHQREALLSMDDAMRGAVEKAASEVISKHYGVDQDPRTVICHVYTVKSVRTQSRDETGEVLVSDPKGPVPFVQRSALFRSIDESESEAEICIFAPVQWTTEESKRKLTAALGQPLTEEIARVVEAAHKEGDTGATA